MSRRELTPLVVACPHCQHPSLIRIRRSSSSSAGLWTDGFSSAEVFDSCGVSICPTCNKVFIEAQIVALVPNLPLRLMLRLFLTPYNMALPTHQAKKLNFAPEFGGQETTSSVVLSAVQPICA